MKVIVNQHLQDDKICLSIGLALKYGLQMTKGNRVVSKRSQCMILTLNHMDFRLSVYSLTHLVEVDSCETLINSRNIE